MHSKKKNYFENKMVQVFDPYFLAMSAIISFGIQLVFFVVAAGLKFDKVTGSIFNFNQTDRPI